MTHSSLVLFVHEISVLDVRKSIARICLWNTMMLLFIVRNYETFRKMKFVLSTLTDIQNFTVRLVNYLSVTYALVTGSVYHKMLEQPIKNIAISVKIAFALSEMTLSLTDMFSCQESVWILKLVMHFFLKFKQSL